MNQDQLKQAVAQAAVDHILPRLERNSVIGVGTGSTANFFIDALARHRMDFDGAVASSEATAQRLKDHGIPVGPGRGHAVAARRLLVEHHAHAVIAGRREAAIP